MNDNKIRVLGECWHENDELGPLRQLSATLTIQKDGTIVIKEMPTPASKDRN
ncbi:MAG TPA: hypothetical protein VF008_11460 [Niastella sp.]